MAQLTITVPDAQVPRIRAAFAPRVMKDAADVTAEDVRLALIDIVKKIVRGHEAQEAEATARAGIVDVDAT